MTTLSRNAQVLRYILSVTPGLGRTLLIKFAYLSDCEARRQMGRAVSDFQYIRYDHGPFDLARKEGANEGRKRQVQHHRPTARGM